MKRRILVLSMCFAYPLAALAQSAASYECSLSDMTRRVVVERAGPESVPCEVAYYRVDEAPGQRQVLWSAVNEAGYCEAQAASFVERLEGFGWQCRQSSDAAATRGRDVVDDTDTLSPATR
jgi:hypothetical protein